MLSEAGWIEGKNWINEVELPGMPNKSEVGYADYVLYDDTHKPLAVVEAKRTCVDVSKGRQQAKLYADLLEAQYNRRPVVFLTNGFETRIIDNQYHDTNLDSRQIYFVNQIVEYIVHNGMMKDLSVLQESPFTDKRSVAEIFTDMTVWMGIRKVIDRINTNAAA